MTAHAVVKSLRPAGIVAGAVGLMLASGGCGSVKRYENPNLVKGKVAFVSSCGSCHTLARAGTKGTIGPNLDAAFRESLASGLGRSAVQSVVAGQIRNPNSQGVMPAGLATGQTVDDIASYVAQAVDNPGQDTGLLAEAVHPAGGGPPAVEKAGVLQINADPTGQLSYVTKKATATEGPVTIVMANMSSIGHNIALQHGTNGAIVGAGQIVSHGGKSTFKANLLPGTYTFFCQVPGHRAAGMSGTLTVK